jgi:hypothetical protein
MKKTQVCIAIVLAVSLCVVTWALEPNLAGLDIEGPNEVAEGLSAQCTAVVIYDDNSTKDVTDEAYWTVTPDSYADINDSGLLSTYELTMPIEDVTIYAEYEEGNDIIQAEKEVQIFAICSYGALEFDGIDDYVWVEDSPGLDGMSQLTISAWIKVKEKDPGHGIVNKYDHMTGQAVDDSYCLNVISEGNARFQYSLGNSCVIKQTEMTLDDGEWHHLAGVYDGATGVIYVDGVQVSLSINDPDPGGSLNNADEPLLIGCVNLEGSLSSFLNGSTDEVTVFERALLAEEVQSVMLYGPDISDSNLIGYWDFDEGQGQVAYDSSGNGNDGYLGSDPCNPDDSDPCWVEPGAPLHCTPRQMIIRNLQGAVEHKENAKEEINLALEKERASAKLLANEMKGRKNYYRRPWIMWPVVEIKKSMLFEEQCRGKLQAGVEALKRALNWLLNDAVPERPQEPDKSSKMQ